MKIKNYQIEITFSKIKLTRWDNKSNNSHSYNNLQFNKLKVINNKKIKLEQNLKEQTINGKLKDKS